MASLFDYTLWFRDNMVLVVSILWVGRYQIISHIPLPIYHLAIGWPHESRCHWGSNENEPVDGHLLVSDIVSVNFVPRIHVKCNPTGNTEVIAWRGVVPFYPFFMHISGIVRATILQIVERQMVTRTSWDLDVFITAFCDVLPSTMDVHKAIATNRDGGRGQVDVMPQAIAAHRDGGRGQVEVMPQGVCG